MSATALDLEPQTSLLGALRAWVAPHRSEMPDAEVWSLPPEDGDLYANVRVLARGGALRALRGAGWTEPQIHQLVTEWLADGGITHATKVKTALGLVEMERLRGGGEALFYTLAPSMVGEAFRLAGGDSRLAFDVWRCLSRIAAMRVNDPVHGVIAQWQATWLRGGAANGAAIEGVSSRWKQLTKILDEQVFGELVANPAPGRHGKIRKLKLEIVLGEMDSEVAKTVLCVD